MASIRRPTISIERCISGPELTEPRLTPDGSSLVYVRSAGGSAALMIHALAGGPDRQLSTYPAPRPGRGMGGGCWCFSADGGAVIYVATDGDLRLQPMDGSAVQRLTHHGPDASASSPFASADGRHVVYTVDMAEVWDVDPTTGVTRRLDDGSADFVIDPCVGPCSSTAWWVEWDVPSMPWDASRFRGVGIEPDGGPTWTQAHPVLDSSGTPVTMQQPRGTADGPAIYVSDRGGWLNLWIDDECVVDDSGSAGAAFEHANPSWGPGQRSYALSPDESRIAFTRNDRGFGRLSVVDRGTGIVTDVARAVHGQLSWVGNRLAALRSGAVTPTQLVVYDTDTWERTIVTSAGVHGWESLPLAEPQVVTIPALHVPAVGGASVGDVVHARLFMADEPVRGLLVWLHGGPTDQWQVTFMPRVAYWRAAGFNVLLPDHRGSTGHGRAYQQALHGRWGELDVADTISAVDHAIAMGWGTPANTVLVGGSAGGFSALGAVAAGARVAGAVVSYPVSDLADLAERSHRFERHYTDTLVGPLPEAAALMHDRSPVNFADRLARVPLLVMHGDADPVVPVEQSIDMVTRVRAAGGDVELRVYPGEGHGLRTPVNQIDEYERMSAFLTRVCG